MTRTRYRSVVASPHYNGGVATSRVVLLRCVARLCVRLRVPRCFAIARCPVVLCLGCPSLFTLDTEDKKNADVLFAMKYFFT